MGIKIKINELVTISDTTITYDKIVFTNKISKWCQLPYPGHPKGCPNYNKSKYCPPNSPSYEKIIKKFKNLKLIIAEFNIMEYKRKMKLLHPDWSDRQLGNLLYWQSQLKKILKIYINKLNNNLLLSCGSGFKGCYSMESVGINVIKTLHDIGVEIETKPKHTVRLICLINIVKGLW